MPLIKNQGNQWKTTFIMSGNLGSIVARLKFHDLCCVSVRIYDSVSGPLPMN